MAFKYKIVIVAVAILLIAILVVGALIYLGCTPIHFHSKPKEGQIKVACVGDSITYGMAIANVFENSYPKQLGDMLGDEYHVLNFGHSGKTSRHGVMDSYTKSPKYKLSHEYQPDIVVLMMGSNDTKGYNWTTKEDFKNAHRELVNSYLNLESKPRVILCTPNSGFFKGKKTSGDYNYGINGDNLVLVSEAVTELAKELDLELVDTHTLTATHPEWYKIDGIHPDKHGAKAMAELIYETITK